MVLFLYAAGTILFLPGINWGGQQFLWKSAQVTSTIVIGVVVLGIFFVWVQ
jgi:hypothetical protein